MDVNINADLGNTIKEIRNTFPSVFRVLDDSVYLLAGQWPELQRKKVEIKHQKVIEDFKNEIYGNITNIPKEDIEEPDISILGPTIEASRFFIENESLRKMFAKVAASSIDARLKNYSRAAFVEFIKQLSPLDIKLLVALKGNMKFGLIVNGKEETYNNQGPGVLPIIDISINSINKQSFFRENVVPDSLSSDLNCSYEELSSSIDNLLRLGIISKKNSELVEWRWRPTRDWFKENKAISDAYDSINKEKDRLENDMYKINHPKNEIKHEAMLYTMADYKSYDLVNDLEEAKNKKVIVNHDRCVMLTSLGKDFTKICL